jgi:hypothetical protein
MKNEEEFQGINFTEEELNGLRIDYSTVEVVDTGRPATGSVAESDNFFSEEMINSAKNIQEVLFGKNKQ